MTLLLPLLAFLLTTTLVVSVALALMPDSTVTIERRLREATDAGAAPLAERGHGRALQCIVMPQ